MIDEREADDVRGWLATAESPSLRLDLQHTVQTGRRKARHRRHRRIAGGGALVLAALLAVPGTVALLNRDTDAAPPATERKAPPDGPFSCTYQALPVPAGLDAIDRRPWTFDPDRMDPSGRYVVTQAMSSDVLPAGQRVPVLWDNGVGRVISPDLRGRPTAVSEKGVVAGERIPGGGTWIYRDGVVSDIPVPAGATGVGITQIAANGDLLGTVYTTAPNTMKAAVWKAGDLANPRYLDAPGEIVSPIAFLPDGGVVGWQALESALYVWNADGQGTVYAAPAGALQHGVVGVGGGYIHGVGKRTVEEDMVPIRWKIGGDGTAEWGRPPTITPPADSVEFGAVGGANGAQVLTVINKTGGGPFDSTVRTVVVRGEHLAQLPAPDGHHASAFAVDEFGTKVAGVVSRPNTRATPVLWTC